MLFGFYLRFRSSTAAIAMTITTMTTAAAAIMYVLVELVPVWGEILGSTEIVGVGVAAVVVVEVAVDVGVEVGSVDVVGVGVGLIPGAGVEVVDTAEDTAWVKQ